MNVIDFLAQGMLMVPMYYSKHTDVFIQTTNPVWFVIGDFITVFVLAWVYLKVSGSFSAGLERRSDVRFVCWNSCELSDLDISALSAKRIFEQICLVFHNLWNHLDGHCWRDRCKYL